MSADAALPSAAPRGSCLLCGHDREWAVWHESRIVGACLRCREARHVVGGGAVVSTARTHQEFMLAANRVMQHYLGEDAPRYGDARFLLDYALSLEDEVQRLRAWTEPTP